MIYEMRDTVELHALKRMQFMFKAPSRMNFAAEMVQIGPTVYGLTARTAGAVRAFRQLTRRGMAEEGLPQIRQAIEFSVTAHWVVEAGQAAVDGMISNLGANLEQLLKDAQGGPFDVSGIAERLKDFDMSAPVPDEAFVVRRFQEVCKELGEDASLYPMYRILSWVTHATLKAAELHVHALEDGSFMLTEQPALGHGKGKPGEADIPMLARCLYWSMSALDRVRVGNPWQEELAQIAADMECPPLPRRTARGRAQRLP